MSKLNTNTLIIALLVLLSTACKDKQTGYKPNVAGKAGELLVIMDDQIKGSGGGELLQELLGQTYLGLPQAEPHFKVNVAPHRSFSSFMKTFRNLVVTRVNGKVKENSVKFYSDMWARPQSLVRIEAKDTIALKQLVADNEIKILSFFNKAERTRNINSYKKYPSDELTKLVKADFGVRMNVPTSLSKKKAVKDFIWMNESADWGFQSMLVYSIPYVGEGSFSPEYILNQRDSVLHRNVPGSLAGSYMTTEHMFPPIYKSAKLNGIETVELRGLWKVQGDMMGGAYILQARLTPQKDRIVITDGFVYSPEKPDKRDKVRQMEALMYTFKFADDVTKNN